MNKLWWDPTRMVGSQVISITETKAEVRREATKYLGIQCVNDDGEQFRVIVIVSEHPAKRLAPDPTVMMRLRQEGDTFWSEEDVYTRMRQHAIRAEPSGQVEHVRAVPELERAVGDFLNPPGAGTQAVVIPVESKRPNKRYREMAEKFSEVDDVFRDLDGKSEVEPGQVIPIPANDRVFVVILALEDCKTKHDGLLVCLEKLQGWALAHEAHVHMSEKDFPVESHNVLKHILTDKGVPVTVYRRNRW